MEADARSEHWGPAERVTPEEMLAMVKALEDDLDVEGQYLIQEGVPHIEAAAVEIMRRLRSGLTDVELYRRRGQERFTAASTGRTTDAFSIKDPATGTILRVYVTEGHYSSRDGLFHELGQALGLTHTEAVFLEGRLRGKVAVGRVAIPARIALEIYDLPNEKLQARREAYERGEIAGQILQRFPDVNSANYQYAMDFAKAMNDWVVDLLAERTGSPPGPGWEAVTIKPGDVAKITADSQAATSTKTVPMAYIGLQEHAPAGVEVHDMGAETAPDGARVLAELLDAELFDHAAPVVLVLRADGATTVHDTGAAHVGDVDKGTQRFLEAWFAHTREETREGV